MSASDTSLTLEQYRAAFAARRFLNVPLAGLLCWAVVGLASPWLSDFQASMMLFISTGSIVYVAMLLSKITGVPFFYRDRNPFDLLFMVGMLQALLVFSIAIPFYLFEPRSVTLSLGILTVLMWLPFSWILQHWVGYVHAGLRIVLVLLAWYIFPQWHFQLIPAIVVVLYALVIPVLEQHWRQQTANES